MTARLLRGVPDRTYHADGVEPGAPPTLSRSCAHELLTYSPLHAWTGHPRLGGKSKAASKPMDRGALIHALLLGAGPTVAVCKFDDWRTNDSKAAKKVALATGRLPVLEKDLDSASEAVGRIMVNLPFDLAVCEEEVTVLWEEAVPAPLSVTGLDPVGVDCRARLDLWSPSEGKVRDFKVVTKGCVNVDKFANPYNLAREGHDLQAGVYIRAMEAARPQLAGRVSFDFVLLELQEPYAVGEVGIEGGRLKLGGRKWDRAVRAWAECRAAGVWPGPARRVASEVSPYEIQSEMERRFEEGEDDGD